MEEIKEEVEMNEEDKKSKIYMSPSQVWAYICSGGEGQEAFSKFLEVKGFSVDNVKVNQHEVGERQGIDYDVLTEIVKVFKEYQKLSGNKGKFKTVILCSKVPFDFFIDFGEERYRFIIAPKIMEED